MNKNEKLIKFAKDVLRTLEANEEWNADILDSIAETAIELGFAKLDKDGMFQVKK